MEVYVLYSQVTFLRFIQSIDPWAQYPLNETDIADDGITIIDVTRRPTVNDGESLPVLAMESCPPCKMSLWMISLDQLL
jgi:hypothetical protein